MINETTACSGWTCAQCGIWVPSGQIHFCGSSNTHQPLLSVPCYACGLNAKIDMLLEKLTKLIDVLNEAYKEGQTSIQFQSQEKQIDEPHIKKLSTTDYSIPEILQKWELGLIPKDSRVILLIPRKETMKHSNKVYEENVRRHMKAGRFVEALDVLEEQAKDNGWTK